MQPSPPKKIRLTLPGYVTPSLNVLLHKHWTVLHRHKLAAKKALAGALAASQASR